MLRSLLSFDPDAAICVLALDEPCERVLLDVFRSSIRVTSLRELHAARPRIAALRESRTPWAYYATLKPAFVRIILESHARPATVTFVDADMRFFSDPSPAYGELKGAEIGLSPHRFSPSLQGLDRYGTYNAGWIYWRAGTVASQCISDWENDCTASCDPEVQSDGRFMNQGYLNLWPDRYESVHILRHPGVNLAPWNIDGHELKQEQAKIFADDRPLICHHFSGLLRDVSGSWHSIYPQPRQFDMVQHSIYKPYLDEVESESRTLLGAHHLKGIGSVRAASIEPGHTRVYCGR